VARLVRPEGIAEQVTRHIRTQIQAGVLRDGQALPSTRQLAEEWGVSVNTINTALKRLMDDGLVVSRDRAGRYVSAPDQRPQLPERPVTPRVVLIGGYAGSGKTELGRIMARRTGWPILDKDTITRPVAEAALEMLGQAPNDRESDTYLNVIRPAEYDALIAAMTENVECGTSTILTAPFLREFGDRAWLDRIMARCAALSATVAVVWVYCDADSMRTYLKHRGAARDTWKLAHWDEYLGSIDLAFRPPVAHRLVDNSLGGRPLHDQAADLLCQITETSGE
jgi:predicted kinase